jgi:hypothetical protein
VSGADEFLHPSGLGNHSVDTFLTGDVGPGEEKFEVLPPAEAYAHWTRNIAGSSGVPLGPQFAVLVRSVDAVLTGNVGPSRRQALRGVRIATDPGKKVKKVMRTRRAKREKQPH